MSKPWYFPLSLEFWGLRRRKRDVVYEGDTKAELQWKSFVNNSVNVHKLSVSFGKVQALRETTFEFSPGQIWGLLGHNGAGKSTLINVLSGACVGVGVRVCVCVCLMCHVSLRGSLQDCTRRRSGKHS